MNVTPSAQNSTESITLAEWELLRIIWTIGPAPTHEIIELAQGKREWSESTIKTLLGRLVKKGFLETQTDHRKFIYHAKISEMAAMDDSANGLFNNLCAMKKGRALINLVENQQLTKSDITTLQQVLASKLATAPEEIACDCLPESAQGCCGTGNCAGAGK